MVLGCEKLSRTVPPGELAWDERHNGCRFDSGRTGWPTAEHERENNDKKYGGKKPNPGPIYVFASIYPKSRPRVGTRRCRNNQEGFDMINSVTRFEIYGEHPIAWADFCRKAFGWQVEQIKDSHDQSG